MFQALIFDFDGLILDSETSMVAAWEQVYDQYGQTFPLTRWLENIGTDDIFDPHAYLENATGSAIDRHALYDQIQAIDSEILNQRGPMPGVESWIAEAQALGLKLAVASSSPARWLNFHLPRLGLLFSFEAVRTSTDVGGRKKPDPAVFLAACAAVGVDPAAAIALEDSLHGIHAAQAAGMKAVAVPNGITRLMDFSAADLVLSSLTEIGPAALLDRLAGQNGRERTR